MNDSEFEKSKIYAVSDIGNYASDSVIIKNILKKNTGNVNAIACDKGEQIIEKFSRFDHFVQIIDGKAEVIIDNQSYNLKAGECIIIPANSANAIKAHEKFKMISTTIKSGYE